MKRVREHLFLATALLLLGILPASADNEPSVPPPFLALAPETPASGVTFFTKKTRLWLGRSQIVCFYAKDAPVETRYFSFKADENFLHVLIPPTLAPGAHIGYFRLRPLQVGHTQIRLEEGTMEVDIVSEPAASTLELTRPEIVAPAEGAVVWGKFVVGVERLNLSTSPPPPAPVLRLPDGRELGANEVPDQQPGPDLRYAFTVDAASLRPGINELMAVFKEGPNQEIVSQPLDIVALAPDPAAILSGDCKDEIQTQLPPPKVAPVNPPVFVPPAVIPDSKGVFGSIVSSPGGNPAWRMPVKVPAAGTYEMMVTARGDIGGNALPTVGLLVDNTNNPATTARLATTEWQRLPVGRPLKLDAGDHVLSVRFLNGFSQSATDSRHLYLARYELARLDELPPATPAVHDPPTSTMQDATATPLDQKTPPAPLSGQMQEAKTSPAPATNAPVAAAKMDDAMAAQPKPADDAAKHALPTVGSFHLAFKDDLDGQVIANQVEVDALDWWPNRDHSAPPTVDLLVNDKIVASQTTPQPRFRIDVSAFQPGKNTVQLQGSLTDGELARSTVENVFLPQELDSLAGTYRPTYRFFVDDPAWDDSMRQRASASEPDPTAAFYTNGDASLTLPEALQGNYKVFIEARGTDFKGPAVATLLVKADGQETKLGEIPAGPNLATSPVAQTTFQPGPKTLVVRYANDAYEQGKGDRNLFVHSVQLVPVQPPANAAPAAAILYPLSGAEVGRADAVVARVSCAQGVPQADLLIDGKPQHLNLKAQGGLGPVLFPLMTRGLTPGLHQLQVAVKDEGGHTGQSGEVTVLVAGKDALANGPYARALLLLNRFGYGPEPRELAAVLTQGPHDWLQARLNASIASPLEANEQERLQAEYPQIDGVIPRALQYLITDADPVRARFLVWTENHFSTWINKDGSAEKAREHERFLELGVAPFPDLLLASATSPAMLIYLDQRNSYANKPNENYAREIMELHTLGVKGGYTQRDVTTFAGLLTGWTVTEEAARDGSPNLERTFRYDPYLNSGLPCEVLGIKFPGVAPDQRFDRVLTALNMLSAHPSCALFISRKLVEHYVSDPAPDALVHRLAQVYLESGGDIREMLLALSEAPEFWNAPTKVASPVDFGVRLARLAGLADPGPVNDLASHSGMGMFDRATPDGYPDANGYFVSSNALLQRWRFAQTIQNAFLGHGLIPNDWKPADHSWDPATTQRLIDLAAIRITGDVLGPDSNDAALQLIAAAPENTDARLHLLTTFLCQVPETSLR